MQSFALLAIVGCLGVTTKAEGAISIDDLEEIPREEWPDLSSSEFNISALGSNGLLGDNFDIYSERGVHEMEFGSDEALWSPFVVNGETYAEHVAK